MAFIIIIVIIITPIAVIDILWAMVIIIKLNLYFRLQFIILLDSIIIIIIAVAIINLFKNYLQYQFLDFAIIIIIILNEIMNYYYYYY